MWKFKAKLYLKGWADQDCTWNGTTFLHKLYYKMVWLSPAKNNERPGDLTLKSELRSFRPFLRTIGVGNITTVKDILMMERVELGLWQLTFTTADGILHPRHTCPFCQTCIEYNVKSPSWNRPTPLTWCNLYNVPHISLCQQAVQFGN